MLLDRDLGYTDNGLHPNTVGYHQLGAGLAIYINRESYNRFIPSELVLTLISGGVKIDWTDNSGGLFETEIWGKNDSDDYTLLYTIAAGTITKSETIDAVDLRYYKIRGKHGGGYTEFSPEESIAMLGNELIVNGDFSAWTSDNPDNWVVIESAPNLITEDSGKCRILTDGTNIQISQLNKLEIGSKYRFKISVINVTLGVIRFKYSNLNYMNINTIGDKIFYGVADGTSVIVARSGATDITFDDISAQKVLMP